MINIGNKLVEALLLDGEGNKSTITFRVNNIEYIKSLGESASIISLASGFSFPVELEHSELKKIIYASDFKQSAEIDLKPVTGIRPQIATPVKKDKTDSNKYIGITIRAILRKEYEYKLKEFSFHEDDISSFSSVSSMAKGGKSVQIEFNESAKKPFDSNRAIIDMPYDDFLKLKVSANNDLSETLNLVEVFAANPKKYGIK